MFALILFYPNETNPKNQVSPPQSNPKSHETNPKNKVSPPQLNPKTRNNLPLHQTSGDERNRVSIGVASRIVILALRETRFLKGLLRLED
ncbi:hypothetical protein [Brunnivagina elsteri]|uniref:Uncharacterized protein n=1 Tax=Brunnivagina elsteri CCALA 953 TaxID=987040 RepID=A0A2A2T9G9_9CYAN|nr:hypothetical protein [Calothrix elsteri]PAX45640.1 hypothetical protein CK510_30760 [Calothrix elsteri CCALA 953]